MEVSWKAHYTDIADIADARFAAVSVFDKVVIIHITKRAMLLQFHQQSDAISSFHELPLVGSIVSHFSMYYLFSVICAPLWNI